MAVSEQHAGHETPGQAGIGALPAMIRDGQTASQRAAAQEATARVTATPEALELIERLRAKHRSVVFFQSGGCCAGSSPMCLAEGDLAPAPNDLRLGEIGGCAFYIDADQYERWGFPEFVVDVAPGVEESFSGTPEAVHFVSRTALHAAPRGPDTP